MSLPQVGDLVRYLSPATDEPYEATLGIVVGYETEGQFAGRTQVIWTKTSKNAAVGSNEALCYPPSRLQVIE